MDTNASKEARRQKWRALLEEWQNSGLSLAAFAEQHKVGLSTLTRYKTLFFPTTVPAEDLPPKFLPVQSDTTPTSVSTPCEVLVRNGPFVFIHGQFLLTDLRRLLACLEST